MRERVWRQVAEGGVRVVAGARSALFLPFRNLGLIVVDEEHDPAYKQEDRVFYNARDMAVVRARIGGFPVVLASATPSVESRVNAQPGPLRPRRAAVALCRCRAARPRSRSTCAARRRLAAASCRRCCSPICASTLEPRRAVAAVPQPARLCAADALPGLRPSLPMPGLLGLAGRAPLSRPARLPSLRASRKAAGGLPGMRHARPSGRLRPGRRAHRRGGRRRISPTPAPSCCRPTCWAACRRLRLELEAIAKGEADIVIGTQLVAKGHNFPNMTLVGVVDADLGLANGDPRAAERTFQLLSQVTGRAGRTGKKSLGLLQTFQPDHPVMRAIVSGDAESLLRDARSPSARRAASAALRPARRRSSSAPRRAPRRRRMRGGCGAPRRRPSDLHRARPGRGAAGAARRPPSLPAAGPGRAANRTCRRSSARCWPRARSSAARSGCRSTSTRRASCER